jgi:hypothetical protein
MLPVQARLAGTDPGEPLRIEELEAEGKVIDAEIDQAVVGREVELRGQLQADEQADVLLDRPDVRLGRAQAARALEAAVEVDEGDAGLRRAPRGTSRRRRRPS